MQLFMTVLWILHELLTLVMFWNLPALHLQEQLESVEAFCENIQPVDMPEIQPTAVDTEMLSRDCVVSPVVLFIPQEPVHVTASAVQRMSRRTPSAEHQVNVSDTSSITVSNEFIEEAEELMHANHDSSSTAAATVAAEETPVFCADTVQHLSWPCDAVSPISRTNSDSFLQRRRHFYGSVKHDDVGRNNLPTNNGRRDDQADTSGVSAVGDVDVLQTGRETSIAPAEPELPSESFTWKYYYDGQFPGVITQIKSDFSDKQPCLYRVTKNKSQHRKTSTCLRCVKDLI